MKASIILYVLLAFLDQGSSLQCEVCDGFEQDCSGYMETCDPDQDTCGIIKSEEIFGGVKIPLNWKSCVTSNVCRNGHFSFFLEQGIRLRRSIACCTGEACRTVSVQCMSLTAPLPLPTQPSQAAHAGVSVISPALSSAGTSLWGL
ncbi:phospholipase A2 inhibitor subunit gamma A-like [Alligator sinensis]|uniref:Phospholipase A2 inhibitor subunit gamma A-like n=1 Tax=Alligator sinensis TaxID=38654 RepID=A0A3Q0FSN6_ALLSI|nr:phospholipase A2 inhibitor subunit gamma A-like [Alligator sinensis]